jgi:hypothetical protein
MMTKRTRRKGDTEKLRRLLLHQTFIIFCIERELGIGHDFTMDEETIMVFFEYSHLPPHSQDVAKPFCELANRIPRMVKDGPQRSVALQKLLEAKDAAVRASLQPGC